MKNKKYPRRSYELKSLPPTKKGHRLVSFSLKRTYNIDTVSKRFHLVEWGNETMGISSEAIVLRMKPSK